MTAAAPDASWYIAELVLEISIEAESRRVVHVNAVLVRADSAEQAYQAALQLGQRDAGEPYLNPQGQKVSFRFVGLRQLWRINEPLEHGAELYYDERIGLSPEQIAGMVSPRDELTVFVPRGANVDPDGPDYSCGEIAADWASYLAAHTAAGKE